LRILGIDPGSLATGYGVVERNGSQVTACAFGRIAGPRTAPLAERLAHMTSELARVLDEWQPDAAAVETPFHGRNTRSLIVLAQARGALIATLATRGLAPAELSPAEVKSAVTGFGRAEKEQVAKMVRLVLGLHTVSLSADASDALAVAICYAQRTRLEAKTRQAAIPAAIARKRMGR
jgi:crossover junction endodeoxyribonuclease RuvC